MNGLVASFLAYLRAEVGAARNTIKAYGYDLSLFTQWAGAGLASFLTPRPAELQRYLVHLDALGLGPASIGRNVAAVKSFFRYLRLDEHEVQDGAVLALESPRLGEHLPKSLSVAQVEALLTAPLHHPGRWSIRDRSILETMYSTGARVTEIATVKLRDLNMQEGTLAVNGKGRKERVTLLGMPALAALDVYLREQRPHLIRHCPLNPWLFVAQGSGMGRQLGNPLCRIMLWHVVKKYGRLADLPEERLFPHALRHSCASHLLAGGADLLVIAELLGHASLATTQIYTQVDSARLRQVHARFHPRGS